MSIADILTAKRAEQEELGRQEQALRAELARLQQMLNELVTQRVYLAGEIKAYETMQGVE